MSARRPRLRALRRRLAQAGCDGFYVAAGVNIRYLVGFTGSSGRLLVADREVVLYTDTRYALQAAQETGGAASVRIVEGDPTAAVVDDVRSRRIRALGFERNRASFVEFEQLRNGLRGRRLTPLDGLVEQLRLVKSADEIELLARSTQLNERVFETIAARVRPTWTELRMAGEIELEMRRQGASGASFPTIVAGGPHGARPHASPRPVRLPRNALIVVDQGAILDGYASDMTRMISYGEPSTREREMADAVLAAQQAALDSIKPGVTARSVDRRAREVLEKHGFGDYFLHSTGHGVGLEIHEAPRLGRRENARLRRGMVVTVEPGVYIEGLGGVRIEELVVVTRDGCRPLTQSSRALRVL